MENLKTNHMKKLLLLIIFFQVSSCFSQQQTLAKFIISDASSNGVDLTERYLEVGGYISFYLDKGQLAMANVMPRANTQSYGRLYSASTYKLNETYENYQADFFYFNWRYINTYDSKKGTAKIELIKIYKPQGIAFICKIIPENLDILIYKGFMEGTLDLTKYD